MSLSEKFQLNWKQNFPKVSTANRNLLLAVSGGVDSVVMTDLVYKNGYDFTIAHCNFKLRGEESERDEAFVKNLGEKYTRNVLVKRFDTGQYAAENKLSIQEAARELRYQWFKQLQTTNDELPRLNDAVGQETTNFLATAHNADDNIETMLLFFFRGTGIHGLTGILPCDNERKIIRPLLFATREEILTYAQQNDLNWAEDSSNASDKYTRNFFRNKLIPAISEHFPGVKGNLLLNLERFNETAHLYQQAIDFHKKKLFEYKGNEIHIPVLKLKKIDPLDTVLWEIIKEYNFHSHQVGEVKKLFAAENSSYIHSSTHRIIKNRNWLIIAPNNNEETEHILIKETGEDISFKNGRLTFELIKTTNHKLQTTNLIAQLDSKHIELPLLLRKWKQGDYFYPFGMYNLPAGKAGKKKLGKFFIDLKLAKTQKENIWVIEMNKKILWVIGYRIDDRFKITKSTKEIFKICFTPAKEP